METLTSPNKKNIIAAMQRNQIDFAALFGSRAKGVEKKDSDYDILIEFSPEAKVGLFKFQEIEEELSEMFGEKVDLVTVGGIDKHVKKDVFNTMKVIYDNRPKRQSQIAAHI